MTNGAGTSNTPPSGPSGSVMPRRSSYASVLSGTPQQSYPSPARAGAFSHLASATPNNSYPPQYVPDHRYHRPVSGHDSDANAASLTAWRKSTHLPSYSRKFAALVGHNVLNQMAQNYFFVPSYLKYSRYMLKLEAAHKARLNAHRESTSHHSSGLVSLSTSSSNVNLHRGVPAHRGMTYDIIENAPSDDSDPTPLPSRWSEETRHHRLEIVEDGSEIRYNGPNNKSELDAACALADNPMPPQCGIYYFEVEIKNKSKDGVFAVGYTNFKASLDRLPGWESDTWAYHGDDGKSYHGEGTGKSYGPSFEKGDVIGCGVDFASGSAFFTRNGTDLGTAFKGLRNIKVYPAVGLKNSVGAWVSANFGQKPFIFDIDGKVAQRRREVDKEIDSTPITTLRMSPQMDESTLVQELVAQFLAHDGYVETGKAFAAEIRARNRPLEEETTAPPVRPETVDDYDAVNRQKIRASILEGDMEKAFKHTEEHYQQVLEDNPEIVFRLKCRKYVEMIRRCSDLQNPPQSPNPNDQLYISKSTTNGHTDVFDEDMELDDDDEDEEEHETETENGSTDNLHLNPNQTDQQVTHLNPDSQEHHNAPDDHTLSSDIATYDALLQEAMAYGQVLMREYRDEKKAWQQTLEDIFSLIAYDDAKASVHGHLLEPGGRVAVAEELNSAILVSLGRSSSPALERLYQQTVALVNDLTEIGGPATLVNVDDVF